MSTDRLVKKVLFPERGTHSCTKRLMYSAKGSKILYNEVVNGVNN